MSARPTTSLCVELLGPPRAWVDGDEVALGPPMRRALFAALAARAGQPVSRTELLTDLWGATRPASAEGNLHTYVTGLRQVLEPGRPARQQARVLTGERGGYLLRIEPGKLDLTVFDRYLEQAALLRTDGDLHGACRKLEAALGLWRGQALTGVPGPFAELLRTRQAERRLVAAEDRAELLLEVGQASAAAGELAVLVRGEPLRERARALLMLALFRAGRQADALATFRDARRILGVELGVEPGPELREMHERILADDPALHPGPRPAPAVAPPAQLPLGVRHFTAREPELARLRDWLAEAPPDRPPLVVLHGIGGVGKTALAVRFAGDVAADFPDGQLYVHLRGFDREQTPLSTGEILAQLLRGLHVEPQAIPADRDERVAAVRGAVAGKRLLIVLDDAACADLLRPVLHGVRGALTLVTTRKRMTELAELPDVRRLSVPVLDRRDSVELLRTAIGAEPGERADRLAELCGDLPLALRVAAERITGHGHFDLADLVDELSAERDRLDVLDSGDDDTTALRAVFSWSYHALAPECARTFRLLGLHPPPGFSAPAAAALIGVSVTTARRLLSSLAGEHLLERRSDGAYRFHDLIRLYAAGCAATEETAAQRERARTRLLYWYLYTMDSAAAVLSPNRPRVPLGERPADCVPLEFPDRAAAIAWCERQRANVLAVLEHAAEHGAHRLAWGLATSSWVFFHLRSHWSDWACAARIAVASATALADRRAEAGALVDLATPLQYLGELDEAETCLRRALTMYRALDDRHGEARTANNLALVLCERGAPGSALAHVRFAMARFGEAGDGWAQAHALGNVGWCHSLLGRHEDAIDYLVRSLAQCRRQDYRWGEGFALRGLGAAYRALHDFDAAASCYTQSLELCRDAGDRRGTGTALESLGAIAALRGDPASARELWAEAIEVLDETRDPHADRVRALLAAL